MTFTAYRDVEVMDGKTCLSSFEVRYTFTVTPGRAASTWTNATDSFHSAEAPQVYVAKIAVRWHPAQEWQEVDGQAFGMLLAEVPDAWFLAQLEEAAA